MCCEASFTSDSFGLKVPLLDSAGKLQCNKDKDCAPMQLCVPSDTSSALTPGDSFCLQYGMDGVRRAGQGRASQHLAYYIC